jgi:predicted transposase YbfD/YdcC
MNMGRKSKKLQELQNQLCDLEVDFELLDDTKVLNELTNKLKSVNDYRHESYIQHKLSDILMITLLATLANANEWIEVEDFAKTKINWLKKFLELPNGIPSDDTFREVVSNIDSKYFYSIVSVFIIEKLEEILKTLRNTKLNDKSEIEKDIMSIDGKTSCGSKRNETDTPAVKALHTLNAYSSDYGMCIGQVFVNEKSNEIPAMQDILDIIDVKNTIVTWDALNTQKETVLKVIKKHGDYVGALKGNQHNFYKDVKDYFIDETLEELRKDPIRYHQTKEKKHSSIVKREYFLTDDIKWLYGKENWKGLETIGIEVKTIVKNDGKMVKENRYFICSFFDILNFSRAVREHWGVENGLHWHLDFTFKDDKNTTMSKNGAKNLQLIKKIALSILKIVQISYKISLKRIRYKLSLNYEKEIENIFKMLNSENLKNALMK